MLSQNKYILSDLDTTGWNSMGEYFNWQQIDFDFLPEASSVPVVDVIADRIKGKDKVFLMVDPETTLKALYNQKSKYNNFLELAKKIKLILYAEDDMMNKLDRTFKNNPDFASWINDLSPIVFTEGMAGHFYKKNYPNCKFIDLWHPHFHHSMSFPHFSSLQSTKDHNPTKDFLCLMCKKDERPHRELLHNKIKSEGLIEQGIYHYKPKSEHTWDDLKENYSTPSIKSPLRPFLPPIEHYRDTNIELVAETFTSNNHDDSFYVTEKTLKPISMKHPFMVLSNFNFLKRLKDLGFKTFHAHLDESYDSKEDVNERIDIIVDNLKTLKNNSYKFYQDTLSIREHNHRHLQDLNGRWKTTLWKSLEQFWRDQ